MMVLEEWNDKQRDAWKRKLLKVQQPELFPNGLMCGCGGYLYDTGQFKPGRPGMFRVKCQSCGFKGERLEEVK